MSLDVIRYSTRNGQGNIITDEAEWINTLNEYATSRGRVALPSVDYDFSVNDMIAVTVRALELDTSYQWRTTIGNADTHGLSIQNPRKYYSWPVEGFVIAQRGTEKNMALLSRKVSAHNAMTLHRCPSEYGGFWASNSACADVIPATELRTGVCVQHTDVTRGPLDGGTFEFPVSGGDARVTAPECQGSDNGGSAATTIHYNQDGWRVVCTGSPGGH